LVIESVRHETIVLIGQWTALAMADQELEIGNASIIRCEARIRPLQLAITTHRPDWLLLGVGLGEDDRNSLAHAARTTHANLRMAVLAPDGDLAVADRWLHRGCSAYLSAHDSVSRVMRILRFARESGVCVVDKSFQDASHRRQVPPVASLTRREREVLHLMRLGRRNREIARELVVSGSTIDFHIRNVLEKMGARNRVEAIKRADMLGL
jgi:two-component system response regulator NreC